MKNFKFKINDIDYSVDINEVEGQEIKLNVNGAPYVVTLDKEVKKKPEIVSRPVTRSAENAAPAQPSGTVTSIATPLPGTIIDVCVKVGDSVSEGQCVAVLEAMKMENNIEAENAGVVTEVKVNKGDSVLEGDVLIVLG